MGDLDDMDNSPFKLLRQKFVEDLEEILECPVCLERLTGSVVQCRKGHTICKICYESLKVKQCPICKCSYNGTTNFLAQNLVTKFEEIKMSLIDTNHSINKIVKNKMSIGTQTCFPTFESSLDDASVIDNQSNWTSFTTENKLNEFTWVAVRRNRNKEYESKKIENKMSVEIVDLLEESANDTAIVKSRKAKFPCQIGTCNKLLSHRHMVTHVKENHAEYFVDVGKAQGKMYTKKWKIQHRPNSIFDQAIRIDNMGMFFIKIVISKEGDFHGHVQLNNIAKKAARFRYSLNVGKHGIYISYKGKVLGSQTLQDVPKGLFISSTSMADLIRTPRSFDCVLKIKRRSLID